MAKFVSVLFASFNNTVFVLSKPSLYHMAILFAELKFKSVQFHIKWFAIKHIAVDKYSAQEAGL